MESISPKAIAHQIPLFPRSGGNKNAKPIWNNNVRDIDIIADTVPLFKAVKKQEANIENPQNKNTVE